MDPLPSLRSPGMTAEFGAKEAADRTSREFRQGPRGEKDGCLSTGLHPPLGPIDGSAPPHPSVIAPIVTGPRLPC